VLVLAAIAAVGLATNHEPDGPPGSSAVVPQVNSARADLASASNESEREQAASALAEQYDRTARSLEAGRLRTSVQRTADAYRRAAVAVRREDGSDYDDAIADARAGERAIERAQRGAGDSQSDDPSDDEPDENEP